ncbi:hypothetical protein BDR07DRAFT_1438263 [Suillus spraguei]|nr:hypothetical protein BDR07DRAFT_1438263 [Suillus spraguei]
MPVKPSCASNKSNGISLALLVCVTAASAEFIRIQFSTTCSYHRLLIKAAVASFEMCSTSELRCTYTVPLVLPGSKIRVRACCAM